MVDHITPTSQKSQNFGCNAFRVHSKPLFKFLRAPAQMNLAFKPRTLYMKAKQAKQQVLLAGVHVVSRDFSDEFPCSGIRVIHKISVEVITLA